MHRLFWISIFTLYACGPGPQEVAEGSVNLVSPWEGVHTTGGLVKTSTADRLVVVWDNGRRDAPKALWRSLEEQGWREGIGNRWDAPDGRVFLRQLGPEDISVTFRVAGPCELGKVEPCIPFLIANPDDPSIPKGAWFGEALTKMCDVTSKKPCGDKSAACKRRKADACLALAVTGPAKEAVAQAEKAALLGNPQGWLIAARLRWTPDANYDTLKTVKKQLTKACEAKVKGACKQKKRFDKDVDLNAMAEKLRADAEAACRDKPSACGPLADALWKGVGGDKDRARAAELYDKACQGGDGDRCFEWGQSLYYGSGVAKDQARARATFKAGCEHDQKRACRWFGDLARLGHGGPKDEQAANVAMRKACKLGNKDACKLVR